MRIEGDYALELLVTADQMLLFDLKDQTETWLCKALSNENVVSLWEFAGKYRTDTLFKKCEEFLAVAKMSNLSVDKDCSQ